MTAPHTFIKLISVGTLSRRKPWALRPLTLMGTAILTSSTTQDPHTLTSCTSFVARGTRFCRGPAYAPRPHAGRRSRWSPPYPLQPEARAWPSSKETSAWTRQGPWRLEAALATSRVMSQGQCGYVWFPRVLGKCFQSWSQITATLPSIPTFLKPNFLSTKLPKSLV